MKIDLDKIDHEQFMVHQHILNGEVCWLVQPQHIGAKYTKDNLIFRSSLWNNDGELISAGFKKFFNWSEQPDVSPVPKSLNNTTIVEKVDGSLLIVSKYKGNYILRTRGTSDASKIDNGHELEIFKQTILPKLESLFEVPTPDGNVSLSFLFEWVTPTNKIILNYGEQPDWYLVGVVKHEDYSLWSQKELDDIAKSRGLKRPVTYTFPTVEDLIKDIDSWKGKEGVCVYSNNGQSIHKVKSAWYLFCHHMKSELGSIEKLIDMWVDWGMPDYVTTEEKITSQFDFELFQQIRGQVSQICDAQKEVNKIVDGINNFISPLRSLSRKDAAIKIISSYGETGRSSMCFTLLDNKPLSKDQYKKLLYQCLKT